MNKQNNLKYNVIQIEPLKIIQWVLSLEPPFSTRSHFRSLLWGQKHLLTTLVHASKFQAFLINENAKIIFWNEYSEKILYKVK